MARVLIIDQLVAAQADATPDRCINWTRSLDRAGRGRVWVNGKSELVYRALWARLRGPIPEGKLICHTCDNASCINLHHLYIGTHLDNGRDMAVRKRHFAAIDPERHRHFVRLNGLKTKPTWGESNPNAKLNWQIVAEIRASTASISKTAAKYGVAQATIWRIRKNLGWVKNHA